jgi:hypothetical protein
MSEKFDPQPADRQWYRSVSTGDRGYLVKRDGKDVIRLDRPMQEVLFPKTNDWIEDVYGSLLLETQAAAIAFAADREVCRAVGLHLESRRGWQDLSDAERIKFLKDGPPRTSHALRGIVYDAVTVAMKPHVREP